MTNFGATTYTFVANHSLYISSLIIINLLIAVLLVGYGTEKGLLEDKPYWVSPFNQCNEEINIIFVLIYSSSKTGKCNRSCMDISLLSIIFSVVGAVNGVWMDTSR